MSRETLLAMTWKNRASNFYSKIWELVIKKNVKYGIITMMSLVTIAIVGGFTLKDHFKTKIMSAKQIKFVP